MQITIFKASMFLFQRSHWANAVRRVSFNPMSTVQDPNSDVMNEHGLALQSLYFLPEWSENCCGVLMSLCCVDSFKEVLKQTKHDETTFHVLLILPSIFFRKKCTCTAHQHSQFNTQSLSKSIFVVFRKKTGHVQSINQQSTCNQISVNVATHFIVHFIDFHLFLFGGIREQRRQYKSVQLNHTCHNAKKSTDEIREHSINKTLHFNVSGYKKGNRQNILLLPSFLLGKLPE